MTDRAVFAAGLAVAVSIVVAWAVARHVWRTEQRRHVNRRIYQGRAGAKPGDLVPVGTLEDGAPAGYVDARAWLIDRTVADEVPVSDAEWRAAVDRVIGTKGDAA